MIVDNQYVLAIDTATSCSSVALTAGTRDSGKVVAVQSFSGKTSHSRRLIGNIDYLLKETGVGWSEISCIGVGTGPGSFTGLRIGMATAKGLAAAAGKRLYGISTLDVVASACVSDRLICSVIDARKKEVYAAFYRVNDHGWPIRQGPPMVVAPEKLAQLITERVLLVGDGAQQFRDVFLQCTTGTIQFAAVSMSEPSAACLGLLVGELLQSKDELYDVNVLPLYVRSSDAELSLIKKEAGSNDSHRER